MKQSKLNLSVFEQSPNNTPKHEDVLVSSGQSFGEKAISSKKQNFMTYECLSDSFFATLEKKDYYRVLEKIEIRHQNHMISFFGQIPILSHYTQFQIKKLLGYFQTKNFKHGHIVFSQLSMPTHVYVVKDGDFEISIKIKIK